MQKQIITTFWLLAVATLFAAASPAPTAEKPLLPADLYFEFKAIPADQNAIIDWRRAAEAETAPNEKDKRALKFCWTPSDREPSTDVLAGLQAWVKRNQQALNLFNASLAKPKSQWPERNPPNPQPEEKSFPLLIRARLFQADQLAEQNKFSAAILSLKDSLKLAQMGIEGDATLIHYLLACSARTAAQDAVLRLACRKEVPISQLEDLLTNLPSLGSETNVYDHVLRVEFTRDYYDSLDFKKLSETWSKMSGTNAALFLGLFPNDLQRTFQVLLDPSLVPLHPKPYDANEEIQKSMRDYRIYRTNSLLPWTERDGTVELETEINRTNLMEDTASLMELVKDDPLPLNRQAVQKARAAYLEINNPIGRIFDTSILGFVLSDLKVCQVRTEREATRACLALIIFERQKGQLPATLSELVQDKILKSVPLDPFTGGPLHYSREKRKVWSVSDDGVDDNGESGEIRWYEKDAVWQIPALR